MTILHSCCCWRSVRKGTIACGVYTGIYYTVNAGQSSFLLHEEINFLKNLSNQSLIDHDITTETSAVFSALIFAFSSCGVVTTLLLFYGIYKDIKYLLIPWIFNMAFFTIVDINYIVYGLIVHATFLVSLARIIISMATIGVECIRRRVIEYLMNLFHTLCMQLQWNPSVAILVTVDFFLNALNLYALLCVISQYQEYKAGRGRAIDDQILRVPNIQYSSTQPTATSYLSSHHRKTLPFIDKPTPTHSPTGMGSNNLDAPPLTNRGPRKSVKFGDSSEMTMIPPPGWIESKTTPSKGIDTAPLIDSRGDGAGTISV